MAQKRTCTETQPSAPAAVGNDSACSALAVRPRSDSAELAADLAAHALPPTARCMLRGTLRHDAAALDSARPDGGGVG
eukprot:365433-Chlamydomonas_euryale.AAC.7